MRHDPTSDDVNRSHSTQQVAERLAVSRATVVRWIAQGHLPAFDISPGTGKPRLRVLASDLAAFIDARRI